MIRRSDGGSSCRQRVLCCNCPLPKRIVLPRTWCSLALKSPPKGIGLSPNASWIVGDSYEFRDGLFSGYDPVSRSYDASTWDFAFDAEGYARKDPTLQHPRCVFQLMRRHFARYDPEACWLDDLEPAFGKPRFEFEPHVQPQRYPRLTRVV